MLWRSTKSVMIAAMSVSKSNTAGCKIHPPRQSYIPTQLPPTLDFRTTIFYPIHQHIRIDFAHMSWRPSFHLVGDLVYTRSRLCVLFPRSFLVVCAQPYTSIHEYCTYLRSVQSFSLPRCRTNNSHINIFPTHPMRYAKIAHGKSLSLDDLKDPYEKIFLLIGCTSLRRKLLST